ncbi:glycosyltransferase [Pseudomonas sp. A1437]|uniref:glycosyltransferase n=1 Tax=unclassified Pseudomonas TaxID=196821 RepID=UPI003784FB69
MPVEHPKVAVLLAAYNGTLWIEEQLTSILGQSAVDVTVYISIDASTDGTEAWCETYSSQHPEVLVLPFGNSFGGASRNFFRLIHDVDFESFDFVAFADQDDVWHIDKLQRAIYTIQTRHVDAYSSNVTAFWPNGKTHLLNKAQAQVEWDFLFEAAGPGCTYLMSKRLADTLKVSVLDNWELVQKVSLHDWYFYAFARSHGFRWYIDPESSMDYRQHKCNQVGANKGLGAMIARCKTIHNGWWFNQVQLITNLVGQDTDPFVQTWLKMQRGHLIRLSFSAWQCRRRGRDKVFFFCICWVAAFIGRKA